jgi:hypothetical protein
MSRSGKIPTYLSLGAAAIFLTAAASAKVSPSFDSTTGRNAGPTGGSNVSMLRGADRQTLREARLAFEKKDYRRSINLYLKIPTASDYWSESLEERAWALVHVNEHDQALSLVKTLTSPPLKSEIGGEPYLLSGIVQLRLCNYDELFHVMKQFKIDIQPRYEALDILAKSGHSPAAEKFLSRSRMSGVMSRQTAGEDLASLPRLVYRDSELRSAFNTWLRAGNEQSRATIRSRLKALAERDRKDIGEVLRKFHLMEVEAVSRMYSKVHLADAKLPSTKVRRDSNTLVFPDDVDDVWLDELNNYHVEANGCPGAPNSKSAEAEGHSAGGGKGPKS